MRKTQPRPRALTPKLYTTLDRGPSGLESKVNLFRARRSACAGPFSFPHFSGWAKASGSQQLWRLGRPGRSFGFARHDGKSPKVRMRLAVPSGAGLFAFFPWRRKETVGVGYSLVNTTRRLRLPTVRRGASREQPSTHLFPC